MSIPVVTTDSAPAYTIDGDPIVLASSELLPVSTLTWGLELELNGPGNGWTDVSDDVRGGIVCEYGITGSEPQDRVASTGTLQFSLDNSEFNSARTLGYYSPFHLTAKRPGFDYNIGVRWWIAYGTAIRYKHLGKLADIDPVPGSYGERVTRCQSLDWMDDAARMDVPDVAAQTDQRADELLTTLLDAIATPPAARDLGIGKSTFAWSLDGGTGQLLKLREELQKIAMSEQGYIVIKADAVQGGTLAFQERGARAAAAAASVSFDNDAVEGGLAIVGGRDDVYKTVQVIVHPTEVEGSLAVLFSLQTTSTLVKAGETLSTIFGPYTNPATDQQCGGTGMVSPAATTDYLMNSAEDGSGTDLTASFTVTASYTGQGVRYTAITNTSGTDAYIMKLKARGYAVNRSDVTVQKTVTGSYGDRVLTLDLPYQSNVRTADKIATYLATLLASPVARVRSVKFLASESAALLDASITLEPGDRVSISEAVTGLTAAQFVIQRPRLELQAPDILWCTWELQPYGLDAWWAPSDFVATGGTITEVGGYTIHTFTNPDAVEDFEIVTGPDTAIECLLVAGGAGGAGDDQNTSGGGGGAGGQVVSVTKTLGVGVYPVTVGKRGVGGAAHGTAGTASSFQGTSAAGGSPGGGGGTDGTSGTLGGGGGADDSSTVGAGGVGTLFSGGAGGSNGGGGGAGASGPGGTAPGFNTGGAGGPGVTSSISGAALGYGGGGSGAAYATPGTATHGGGTGATLTGAGGSGTAHRGGGGGGGRFGFDGGDGSDGVVILRYPTPE